MLYPIISQNILIILSYDFLKNKGSHFCDFFHNPGIHVPMFL